MNHGTGWEYRFPFERSWRGRRRRSPKGAARSDCKRQGSCQVVICQRWPRHDQFHARSVASGTRTINKIFLRCLRNKIYRTILHLHRSFVVKTWWQPSFPMRWFGTDDWSHFWSWQGGLFRIFPMQGLVVSVPCGGRSHEEEHWTVFLCFPTKFVPYDVRTLPYISPEN